MKNFAKSILNYFAAYNETRFRFTTRASQKWSNNELTLDFSIFPEFEDELLNQIQNKHSVNLSIKPKQYSISLDNNEFIERLTEVVESYATTDAFTNLKNQDPSEELDDGEIYRQWNLGLRKKLGNILLEMQEEKKQELIADLDVQYLPISTLNTARTEQDLYEEIKKIEIIDDSLQDYIAQIKSVAENFKPDLTMFDLFSLIQSFNLLSSSNTIHLFLHNFSHEGIDYPIATIEMQIAPDTDEYFLRSTRNLVQLNTPAINASKMGKVLTTPRACSIEDLPKFVNAIEMYFQAYYHHTHQFFFQSKFKSLVGSNLPTISARIGLQIVEKEDRKLLDYSELITNIDSGSGKKFADFIESYVDDNVENTSREVHESFMNDYPEKSPKNFYSDIPISLNLNQKKILTAAKNPKNQIMVIDGPPGTGKSYTITALVYLANILKKKILITSHKTQALDVVEETLTRQYQLIHPAAKPPILRITKPDETTLNSIDNTLSDSVINQTLNRTHSLNTDTVHADLEKLEAEFGDTIDKDWKIGALEYEQIEKMLKLATQATALGIEFPEKYPTKKYNFDNIKALLSSIDEKHLDLSLNELHHLYTNKEKINLWIEAIKQTRISEKIDIDLSKVSLDQVNELKNILATLLKFYSETTKLADVHTVELSDIPKLSNLSEGLTWDQLKEAHKLIKKLSGTSKQLTTKIFGSEEKRRIEHTIKLDYPNIAKEIQKNLEETLFSLERDINHVQKFIDKHPNIKRDMIISDSQSLANLDEANKKLLSDNLKDIKTVLKEITGENLSESKLLNLSDTTDKVLQNLKANQSARLLDPLINVFSNYQTNLDNLSQLLISVSSLLDNINPEVISDIDEIFEVFSDLLATLSINKDAITRLAKLFDDSEINQTALNFINSYSQIDNQNVLTLRKDLLDKQQQKRLRLLMHNNEERFAELNRYPKDVQRILTAIKTNQRLTSEQADVLFNHIPCVIAPPDLISSYFPMDNDMIDWLIIDEASQVSIAESLSLMLRAKQTMVFGDELQYGAVGATNVSLEYSKEYFRNVLDDYMKDKHEQISEEILEQIATDVSKPVVEDEVESISSSLFRIDPNTKEWLKTFNIRTSTLDFAKAIRNYSDSLTVHFRSYPELISYSNDFFYKPSEINLVTSRIRTKPINQTIEFVRVNSKGIAGNNVNLDEIEAIRQRLSDLYQNNFAGSIGIICSFREQTDRMKEILRKDLDFYGDMIEKNNLKIWFVGDVQGEERDIVFYSFVEDKKIGNASLSTIYPVVGGVADNIRNLRMQRLNVGFSRAKDTMVFVHSMDINEYKDTRLGDALEHYWKVLNETTDNYIEDTHIFGSPAEERLYSLITQTDFYNQYKNNIKLIAQFEIGKYLKEEFRKYIPNYRVDFLLTFTVGHKEHSLIIEYDGIEFHTKSPHSIGSANEFDQEYIDYDIQRQLELESYGYHFLRINKFTLKPSKQKQTEVDVLNDLLSTKMESAMLALNKSDKKLGSSTQIRSTKSEVNYSSSTYKSPMEELLSEIIKGTEFFKLHQEKITLTSNFILKNDNSDSYPKHMPEYVADFMLKMNDEDKIFKLIIEYDGIRYHSDNPNQINSEKEFADNLSDDHKIREEDIKELGYQIIRLNKFNLFNKKLVNPPEQIVDEMIQNQYNIFMKGQSNE